MNIPTVARLAMITTLLLAHHADGYAYQNLTVGGPYNVWTIRDTLEAEAGRTIAVNGCPTTFYVNTVTSLDVGNSGCSSMPSYITCSGTSPNMTMTISQRWQGGCSGSFYGVYNTDTYKIQTEPINTCASKTGQSNYKLDIHASGTPVNLAVSCYEDCKTTAEELWEDCINDQCVSSVKHTFTGEPCSGQPALTDLEPTQPNRCDDELALKIASCGGSLNVQSFNFENCTGTCTPDSCSEAYALKVQSCGGVMAVASWDETTCKGTCVSDPIPQEPEPTDKPPVEIEREEVVNSDGSKEETRTTTQYNSETNTTYTTTTTTTYNSSGVQTGQTISTTISPGKPNGEGQGEEPGETETFSPIGSSGFGEAYTPDGEYDIPVRFNTFLNTVKSSGLFSFSSGFFNSLPGGGSPVYTINGGQTFGSHSIDLSETMTIGLAVLKTILMACFGFLSIRAIIMKR